MPLSTTKIDVNRGTTGVALPSVLVDTVIQGISEGSAVMQLANRMVIPGSGVTMNVITGDPEPTWTAESTEKTVSEPTFANKVMQPYKLAFILPWAMEGNPLGVLPFLLGFPLITVLEGLFFTNLGYRLGRAALGSLFASGAIDRLIECASMIGMMMGALGSSYVSLTLANEEAQATLGSIVPGLLPLLLILAVFLVMRSVTQKVQ